MKRTAWTAVLAAGLLAIAGCSSTGSTAGSSTSAASSSAPSTASSATSPATTKASAASSSAAGSAATSAGGSAAVAPATLDAQTEAWFTTLCGGVKPLASLAGLNTSGQDNAAAQQTGVQALQQFSGVLTQTATALGSTPPPTFAGGSAFAAQLASGLAASGTQISAVATSFAAVNPADDAAFQQAATALTGQLSTALAPLQAIGQLDPAISAAAQEIPDCKSLAG